jgi:fluoride exporter
MFDAALVVIGGGAGAVARFLIVRWIQSSAGPHFPWGVFVINITCSFAIGVVLGAVQARALPAQMGLLLATGFLGGYTTFSSYSVNNLQLLAEGNVSGAVFNALGQVILGLIAVWSGTVATQEFFNRST